MSRDDKLLKFYRWLLRQGIEPDNPEMQEFRRLIENDSTDIVERVRRIKPVSNLAGLYNVR